MTWRGILTFNTFGAEFAHQSPWQGGDAKVVGDDIADHADQRKPPQVAGGFIVVLMFQEEEDA